MVNCYFGNSFGLRGIKLEHNKNNVTSPSANKWRAAHPVVILNNSSSSDLPSMNPPTITPSQVRRALLLREEIALLDVRHEAAYATGHPLFAANMAADRIALEAGTRLPRKDVPPWLRIA